MWVPTFFLGEQCIQIVDDMLRLWAANPAASADNTKLPLPDNALTKLQLEPEVRRAAGRVGKHTARDLLGAFSTAACCSLLCCSCSRPQHGSPGTARLLTCNSCTPAPAHAAAQLVVPLLLAAGLLLTRDPAARLQARVLAALCAHAYYAMDALSRIMLSAAKVRGARCRAPRGTGKPVCNGCAPGSRAAAPCALRPRELHATLAAPLLARGACS